MKNKNQYTLNQGISTGWFVLCILALLFIGLHHTGTAEGASTSTISEGDEWQYFKGVEEPPSKWNYLNYDASGWMKGRTGFGYGSGTFRTPLNDMKGNFRTLFARREFNVNNPAAVKSMILHIRCDGPFAAYINGIEVISNSEPVNEDLDISGFTDVLLTGLNVLAVQCANDDLQSDNFSFIPAFKVSED